MASRVFTGISGQTDSPEISRDYENSTKLDKVHVGKLGVFTRGGDRFGGSRLGARSAAGAEPQKQRQTNDETEKRPFHALAPFIYRIAHIRLT